MRALGPHTRFARRPCVLGVALALACAGVGPPPVIEQHVHGPVAPALERPAIARFTAGPAVPPEHHEAVLLIERFFTEALAGLDIAVIAASDVEAAVARDPGVADPGDRAGVQRVVVRDFAATGLVVGRVLRYRERSGQQLGSEHPASVAFEVVLYGLPEGRRLWSGAFDETQISLTEGPGRARRYPGGGTRWLTALELSRWGAQQAARALAATP